MYVCMHAYVCDSYMAMRIPHNVCLGSSPKRTPTLVTCCFGTLRLLAFGLQHGEHLRCNNATTITDQLPFATRAY